MKITKDMMINFIKQQARNVYYDTEGNLDEEPPSFYQGIGKNQQE